MNRFNREDRYIVVKRSDLAKVVGHYHVHCFMESLLNVGQHLPKREFLVIESDWPEYGPAWRMIEQRMSGAAPVVERQPVAYRIVFNDGEKGTWLNGLPPVLDNEDVKQGVIRAVEVAYSAPPELAELQATIARLTAENEMLKRGVNR